MSKAALGFWMLLVCVGTTGCPALISRQVSRDENREYREGACFPELPRFGIARPPQPPPGIGEVLAGFQTHFFRGAQPWPCNRRVNHRVQGAFDFDGSGLPPDREISAATLIVDSFRPAVPLQVWPKPAQRSLPYSRDHCFFRVAQAELAWSSTGEQPFGFVHFSELATGRARFAASSSQPGAQIARIDVTQEVNAWRRGERVQNGFVIHDDDQAALDGHNNSCLGYFVIYLDVQFVAP